MKYSHILVLVLWLFTGLALASESAPQIPPSPYTQANVAKVEASTLAEFEAPYFLECADSRHDGSIVFTSHNDGRLYRVHDNKTDLIAGVNGKMTCLEPVDDERYLITGWNEDHDSVLYLANMKGDIQEIEIPEAMFLNGILALDSDRFLIADSYKGVIWQYTLSTNDSQIWLDHPLLKRASPEQTFPGINGIQRQGNSLYFANNARMLMGLIKMDETGAPVSTEIYQSSILIDDFVVDSQHHIYGATHIYDSVIHITPDHEVTIIADSEEGVTGSTSVSWSANQQDLIVTTNGGLLTLTPEHAKPAKLVKLKLSK